MFSVDTEEQAKRLVAVACQLGYDGNYYARELGQEQTFQNLAAFSDKLAAVWERMK